MGKPLAALGATVVLVAGIVVMANVLWSSEVDGKPVAAPTPPATCENSLTMYFSADDDMTAAAYQLRDHPHVSRITTETRKQAAKRLGARFAELEKFLEAPYDYSAAVHLTADGAEQDELVTELAGEVMLGLQTVLPASCEEPTSDPFAYITEVPCGKVVIWFDGERERRAVARELRHDAQVGSTVEQGAAEVNPRSVPIPAKEVTLDVFTLHGTDIEFMALELAELPGVIAAEPSACVGMPHPALDGGPI